ncbi:histidine kinase [Streptomyces sp. NPDC046887]|uniref:sensor histidine kinase n=1 Tax=Streptomyces sp. NPDC046887 TaxID=3155472 RepID=UPI0034035C17
MTSTATTVTTTGVTARSAARALFGRQARLRWVHLVLGGALLMPFWLLGVVVIGSATDSRDALEGNTTLLLAAYAAALPLIAVAGRLPVARPLSVAAARSLCGQPAERFADGPARGRSERARTACWLTLHLGVGAAVAGASLAVPPFAVALMAAAFRPGLRAYLAVDSLPATTVLLPLLGVASLMALVAVSAAAGALLARCAPLLLGPSPADRLAAAERRAAELAERNRLARELHDSVGHALSAVTLQAGAARRMLDERHRDLDFVTRALTAIEETTRRTVGELDAVLGLLRQDDGGPPGPEALATAPTLASLDTLVAAGGAPVDVRLAGDPLAVPAQVSREAYRIVQEGLGNALRHAGAVPVELRITAGDGEMEITMDNPMAERRPAPRAARAGGGRGLRGIAERAALWGGRMEAGPRTAAGAGSPPGWRLHVVLPYGAGTR